jgi:hypothetical protein
MYVQLSSALEERALDEANKYSQIVFIDCFPVSDWIDSLIGPSGVVALRTLPPTCSPSCSPSFSVMGGVEKH